MIRRAAIFVVGLTLAVLAFLAASQSPSSANAPTEAVRLNNLGAAYMNQQFFEKALKSFQAAAALDANLQVAGLNQGIALLNMGKVDQARVFLEQAIKQRPEDPHAWYNFGLLSKNSDHPQAAVDAFKRVTEIDPNDADTWYFLGAAFAQVKQFVQAMDAFQHALKLNSLHASAQFGLSRALQQSGDVAQAREHLQRFQYITQNKLSTPIGLAYGDQGRYSFVEEAVGAAEKVLPQIKVRFVDVTKQAGLVSGTSSDKSSDLASFLGPGACFLDYDGDGRPDIFLADHGPQGGIVLYHNLGNGRFEEANKKTGLDSTLHGIACTAGDYDNDGAVDLAVALRDRLMLLHNARNGTFVDVTGTAGIKPAGPNVGITFIDYDHDGDLDLFITRNLTNAPAPAAGEEIGFPSGLSFPGDTMWRNNGNGTFTDVTTGLEVYADPSVSSVGTDYNNDRAVDLVVTDLKGPTIFENPREGKFFSRGPWSSNMPAVPIGIGVLDFNHDGWMDLAFTHGRAPGLTLWRNNHAKSFEQVKLPETNWVRAFGVAAFDYDNDGWVDLAAVGETKDGRGEIRLFRNLGPDGWKDVTAEVGLDKIPLKDPRALVTADYDGDGATDLLITQNHAPAVLLHNVGGNQNHWLRLSLKGLSDNKSAIGTKVEVFAGGNRQKFEIAGSSGYLGQNSTELTIGLGKAKEADVVRLLWPGGVLQDEIEVPADREQKITEIDRRGSSCPTLFVWDGKHYELVDDMIGAGVVGHWVAPGERNIPRSMEYIKLDRSVIHEKVDSHPSQNRGRMGHPTLSFRFMEPLEEAVYVDQVRLLAIDHLADVDVYPNEYFASNPPYPSFKVVVSKDARPPAGAWDEHGHNLLPALLAHKYVGDFQVLSFKGFTRMHSLELDLGEPYSGGPLWLLAHGEIEYFTATGMYAAEQAGLQPVSPYVEALTNGKWIRVVDDMGFPAGGPRTITADLAGKLPEGTQRIRITTNLQIYWNSILINRASQDYEGRITPVPLSRADLRFHGFPLKIEGQPPGNIKYVYEKASPTGPYTRPAGNYTRYGDVLPLLASSDDRFAIFGSGDEVALDFDPTKLPVLPQGWVRDYFFVANGYEKDMDFYAYNASSVDPLPFHSMGTYPYPGKSFPLDEQHLDYLLNYNTRHLSGNEFRGYSYDYGSTK